MKTFSSRLRCHEGSVPPLFFDDDDVSTGHTVIVVYFSNKAVCRNIALERQTPLCPGAVYPIVGMGLGNSCVGAEPVQLCALAEGRIIFCYEVIVAILIRNLSEPLASTVQNASEHLGTCLHSSGIQRRAANTT